MITYDRKAAEDIERSYQSPEIINQRNQTIKSLALRTGERVLDVGCGTGLLLQLMSKEVGDSGEAVGVDLSAEMLEFAMQRCGEFSNVRLSQGNAEDLEFNPESFDVVTCTQTLLYVDHVEQALREIHRVLKPQGRIAVLETDWRGLVFNNLDNDLIRRLVDAWDGSVASPNLPVKLSPLLKKQGFSAVEVTPIPILNTSLNGSSFSASMIQWFGNSAVKKGAISQQEADQWLQQVNQDSAQDAYFFCVNRFLFTAVK